MKSQSNQMRTILIVAFAVVAVALAVWSGIRAFKPGGGGKAIGSLGDLSRDREVSGAPPGMQPPATSSPAASPRDREASGAPPGTPGGQGGR